MGIEWYKPVSIIEHLRNKPLFCAHGQYFTFGELKGKVAKPWVVNGLITFTKDDFLCAYTLPGYCVVKL
jgi:hypothetical protein